MPTDPITVGRCELFGEIARGGMATVHVGRVIGASRFAKTVAIKRMHDIYAKDADFADMFLDEARLVARVRHPNVVSTLDLIEEGDELLIVMDYVEGVTLRQLIDAAEENGERIPHDIAASLVTGALRGLHAAHEAKNEAGEPLGAVHRDVSPDNILVGRDGFPRLIDFGIAKALDRVATTGEGDLKGKINYMAPEMLSGGDVTRRTDVYMASIVLWELITGERLFEGKHAAETIHKVSLSIVEKPSSIEPDVPAGLDNVVMRGLAKEPSERWATAEAMAETLESFSPPVSPGEIGAWVEELAGDRLAELRLLVGEMERAPRITPTRDQTQITLSRTNEAAPTSRVWILIGAAALAIVFFVSGAAIFGGGGTEPATSSPVPVSAPEPVPVAVSSSAAPLVSVAAPPPPKASSAKPKPSSPPPKAGPAPIRPRPAPPPRPPKTRELYDLK